MILESTLLKVIPTALAEWAAELVNAKSTLRRSVDEKVPKLRDVNVNVFAPVVPKDTEPEAVELVCTVPVLLILLSVQVAAMLAFAVVQFNETV